MKFIDMFCGMGTARMGFEQAGHECVYSIEWDKHKRRIYDVIFGNEPEGRDIRDTRAAELPQSDCWVAGFPCQDISVAGKQVGFEGNRSSLYFQVMRLLHETQEEDRPQYLLFENVKNFFSVNGGRDFLSALVALDEVGYDAEWDLLNSKNFGVPQNRERVFIVGHFRGRSTREVFPIAESGGLYNKQTKDRKENNENTLCLTAKGQSNWTGSFIQQTNPSINPDGTITSIDAHYYKGIGCRGNKWRAMVDVGIKQIGNLYQRDGRENPNDGRIYDIEGIAPCLNKMESGNRQPFIKVQAVLTPDRLEKRQNGRRMKEDGEPMFTLTGQDRHGVMITEATKKGYVEAYEGDSINFAVPGSKTRRGRVGVGVANTLDTSCNQGTLTQGRIRRLTPRECLRLQGVPEYIIDKLITAGISDTQLYRAAGDAWSVPVGYEIARRLT
jgi:DNA (cytosine-5)-methyltransferase 1